MILRMKLNMQKRHNFEYNGTSMIYFENTLHVNDHILIFYLHQQTRNFMF